MANFTFTRNDTLPDSAAKADFYNLIDTATGQVTNIDNSDIASAAAIADTKLATISTTGKVSGTALTGLASTPSGAGRIPSANMTMLDEDDMASDSDTDVPTQQSVKEFASTFGTVVTGQSVSTIYQAPSDGFVFVAPTMGGSSQYIDFYYGSSSPGTKRCSSTPQGNNLGFILHPVKKDYYYKIEIGTGTISSLIYEFWPKTA